jgi:hypothetical protein
MLSFFFFLFICTQYLYRTLLRPCRRRGDRAAAGVDSQRLQHSSGLVSHGAPQHHGSGREEPIREDHGQRGHDNRVKGPLEFGRY